MIKKRFEITIRTIMTRRGVQNHKRAITTKRGFENCKKNITTKSYKERGGRV
jgi:hypothetical protein